MVSAGGVAERGRMAGTTMRKRSDWKTALDQLTVDHADDAVTIEVIDPTVGPRSQAERLPFTYLTYDPKDDVVIVAVGGRTSRYPVVLRHMIWHPSEVDVSVEDAPRISVRVVEPDGTTTLITVHPEQA
jgi:hypothetical protein